MNISIIDTAIELNDTAQSLAHSTLSIIGTEIGTVNRTITTIVTTIGDHHYADDDFLINDNSSSTESSFIWNFTFHSDNGTQHNDTLSDTLTDIGQNMTNQLITDNYPIDYNNQNFQNTLHRSTINSSKVFTSTLSSHFTSTMTSLSPPLPNLTVDASNPPNFDYDQIESCYASPKDYDPITATICAALLIFGIFYLLYGYRCFKAILFVTGFIFASTVIYIICLSERLMPTYGNIAVSVVAGFLFGLITMLVAYVGLFMLGLHLGALTTTVGLVVIYLMASVVEWIIVPRSFWVIFGLFMGIGLIGACGTLYFQRGCTVMATVLYGSALTLVGVDYFIENFRILFWLRDKMRDNSIDGDDGPVRSFDVTQSSGLCTISMILLGLWPLTVIMGILIQWFFTGKGINYGNDYNYGVVTSSAVSLSDGQSTHLKRIREEQRLEQRQQKYRYLYQVRTAHGDVISQNYIQSLNRKVCPDDSLTFNSDLSSHFTVIPTDSRTTTMSVA